MFSSEKACIMTAKKKSQVQGSAICGNSGEKGGEEMYDRER